MRDARQRCKWYLPLNGWRSARVFLPKREFRKGARYQKLRSRQYKCDVICNFFVYNYFIQNEFLYIPYFFLFASLVLIAICVWPRNWPRQDSKATIEKYGCRNFNEAAAQLAVNYATWDDNLKKIYNKKLSYFEFGLMSTLIAFILEILIFVYFSL